MPDPDIPNPADDSTESFGELLSQYEKSHARKPEAGSRQLEGTVIKVTADSVLLDIGYKTEGILPLSAFPEPVKPGDKVPVTIKGRDPEGYYELSRFKVARPTDWDSLQKAFDEKTPILGTVTAVVKGGLSVDVGVRAFMPASRSGERETAAMEKLVGQEIRCRITKLDITDEDLVVDRRSVLEDEARAVSQQKLSDLKEGDTVRGTVSRLADYGAFIDLGGIDGLLHVGEMSWARVHQPSDVLSVGQEIEARVLKIDAEKRRISLGLKQLQPQPWDSAPGKYRTGERIRGTVSRLADFGAFVELEPGIEGLIHVSEMSWTKRVRRPEDLLKVGETVEAIVLGINPTEHRISLGLKQTLGDPWADAATRFAPGHVVEGPVTNITKFGAFVQVAEGVEGMVHVSEIVADRRINHPQDVLKVGQVVRAQVLAVDTERRNIRLSMKQLIPTSFDEYVAEQKVGDIVTGRVMDLSGATARVELGEGIHATCRNLQTASSGDDPASSGKADLSSLTSMLQARWKGAASAGPSKPEPVAAGQVRSFKITKLDPENKQIEVELAK